MKQTKISFAKSPLVHGGTLAQKKRKTLRPLSSKRPLHLVLKARKALPKHRQEILLRTEKLAAKFQLRVYSIAVASDHVHLVVRIPGRREYIAFVRSLTALLAKKLGKGLWALLPFTRVASWGKDFRGLLGYLELNRKETSGEVEKRERAPRRNRMPGS